MKDFKYIDSFLENEIQILKKLFEENNRNLAEPIEPGKWSPLQHLDHLNLSMERVNKLLRWTPRWFLHWKFGKPNRPSRSFDELKNKYFEKLKTKNPERNPFSSGEVYLSEKEKLVENFEKSHRKFLFLIKKWNESEAEKYIVPHPLLGKITIKELFYFMAFHVEHHRKSIV